jgi:hypothetical protein
MTKKDIKRLNYLDTELSEITLGLTWLLFFPVILILEKGFNPFLIIPSVLIGLATIKSALSPSVKHRKTMAYACFIMSIVATSMFILADFDKVHASHLLWIGVSVLALFNLKRLTNRFYKCKHG